MPRQRTKLIPLCLAATAWTAGVPACSSSSGTDEFADPQPISPIVRRLTTDEYARTVRDVIGVELSSDDLAALPVARPVEGFVHIASGQTVLTDHVLAYSVLADRIVGDPAFSAFVNRHSTCQETTRECADGFVTNAGAVLFRRPMKQEDKDLFGALFEAIVAEQGDYREAVDAVSRAFLQSPGFLYLLQNETEGDDGIRTLTGYEMASRLAYFLWGSAPDDELYAAAAAGGLDDPAGISEQATRMLANRDKVREGFARFVVDWARMDSLPDDDGLKRDRIEGAIAYYLDRIETGADLFGLYNDNVAFMTPELAESYGIAPDGTGVQKYILPAGMGPGGLLGQPGVIAGMTNADGGEIVARGLFLLSQLYCQTPPQFPASLQETIDEFIYEQRPDASNREIAEARLERPSCGGCHSGFDPLGYGFEQFDHRGSYRTEDQFGNVLSDDGWIPAALTDSGEEQPYANIDEYMALLSQSAAIRHCLTKFQTEFALGLRVYSGQQRAVAEIDATAAEGGGDHESLVLAIVTHELFRTTEVAR